MTAEDWDRLANDPPRDPLRDGVVDGKRRREGRRLMSAPTLADLLRAAADLVAAHPEIPAPYVTGITYDHSGKSEVDLKWFLDDNDPAEQKRTAASIVKAIGGKWDKVTYGDHDDNFRFLREVDELKLTVLVEREAVCERIVTGVETVTVPAVAAKPERTEEREVVEWRCEPLLAEVSA